MKVIVQIYSSGKEVEVELSETITIDDVKGILEVETGVASASQLIIHNGRFINYDGAMQMKQFGIKEHEKLIVANKAEIEHKTASWQMR